MWAQQANRSHLVHWSSRMVAMTAPLSNQLLMIFLAYHKGLFQKGRVIQELQNHSIYSIQFDLDSMDLYSWQATVPTSQKKKILPPISTPGQRQPCEWG